MTDAQLYLAIGIPSALFGVNFLALLAGFFWQAKRYEDMSQRFVDVNKRIDDCFHDVNKRIDDFKERFNDVNRHIDDKFALLSQQIKAMEDNILRLIGDHETRIQKLEKK